MTPVMQIQLALMSVPGADIEFSFSASNNGKCFIVLSVRDTFHARRQPMIVLLDDDARVQDLIDAATKAREKTHEIMGRMKAPHSTPQQTDARPSYCMACGSSMPRDYTFCTACGQRIGPAQLQG